jgi:hypothetical protein
MMLQENILVNKNDKNVKAEKFTDVENFNDQNGIGPVTVPIYDSRNSNPLPSEYRARGMGKSIEFKHTAVIGVNNPAMYSLLETYVPWPDVSGGPVHQRAMIWQNTWTRHGQPDDSGWSDWRIIATNPQ